MVAYPALSLARVEPPGASTPSVALKAKRAEVTFDATWTPYVQGVLTCQLQSAADMTATDPRKSNGLMTKFRLSQRLDQNATQQLDLAQWLRSRVNDYLTGEATFTFAGVESVFQDYVDDSGNTYGAAVNDTDVIDNILRRSQLYNTGLIGYSNPGGAASYSIAAADAAWDAGTALWDAVQGIEQPKSLWLRGDELGLTVLRSAVGYTADSSIAYLYGKPTNGVPGRVIAVQDTIDRDSPDWANAVAINYRYNKGANVASDYGIAGAAQLRKSVVIERTGRRTATGEAAARAARMVKRGRSLAVTAIADLTLRPNRQCFVGFRDVSWYGIVRSVKFRWPEGLMDVVVDITESQT